MEVRLLFSEVRFFNFFFHFFLKAIRNFCSPKSLPLGKTGRQSSVHVAVTCGQVCVSRWDVLRRTRTNGQLGEKKIFAKKKKERTNDSCLRIAKSAVGSETGNTQPRKKKRLFIYYKVIRIVVMINSNQFPYLISDGLSTLRSCYIALIYSPLINPSVFIYLFIRRENGDGYRQA